MVPSLGKCAEPNLSNPERGPFRTPIPDPFWSPTNQFELISALSEVSRAQSYQSVLFQIALAEDSAIFKRCKQISSRIRKICGVKFWENRCRCATKPHTTRTENQGIHRPVDTGSDTLPQKQASWQNRLNQHLSSTSEASSDFLRSSLDLESALVTANFQELWRWEGDVRRPVFTSSPGWIGPVHSCSTP